MKMNPLFLTDFYKADHRRQYPENTSLVYSNFTPRSNKYAPGGSDFVIVFGIQYIIKEYLIDQWNENFFNRSKLEVVEEYKSLMDRSLGEGAIAVEHIEALHDYGKLPIIIKALPEGTKCPIGVPMLTIYNTKKEFFWITNYLETMISNLLWKPTTSATTAYQYRVEFERHAALTGSPKDFISWQGHDFSYRGMSGTEDAILSGMGHLTIFNGTDTIPAIVASKQFYPTDEFIGGSVPATEHSVMCMNARYITMEDGTVVPNEFETFKRLITEVYPTGIVSIVSDTWDLWKVLAEYLPALKDEINARDGRVVIRPDSGDPVDIVCGEPIPSLQRRFQKSFSEAKLMPQATGAYELLWDIFGGTTNIKGYKVLNPKVGLIYGDSITLARQKSILSRLEKKNFTASNLVLGIGSYTYVYVTRDSYGFAMKATYGEVTEFVPGEGGGGYTVGKEIFKDPITDDGMKKSAKGLLQVYKEDGVLNLKDQCTWEEESQGELKVLFDEGDLVRHDSLIDVRNRIAY